MDGASQSPPLFSKNVTRKASLQKPKRQLESSVSDPCLRISEDVGDDASFRELGVADWLLETCSELGMRKPTPVQRACMPQILNGKDVLGIAQTGSGKTAAFALPILQRLGENPYGIFALVLTPTRELAFQIGDQFRALGSALRLRCTVVVGGMDMLTQAQELAQRPHVVIATPGRIMHHLASDPTFAAGFSKLKFLVLDEADRLLDVRLQDELNVVFDAMPMKRQTLLFSATMTAELKALHEVFGKDAFFYQAYEGFKTVELLRQQFLLVRAEMKDVYLKFIMSIIGTQNVRSAIIFVSKCRTCHQLHLILDKLGISSVALHSLKVQKQRLASLNRFKSAQVPILIATDVASRGLDIPIVDLVVNYDIPRSTADYVHRVGRTARAGRDGCAISLVTERDVNLVLEIETFIGKKLEEYAFNEAEALKDITTVFKARREAVMEMEDGGFDELAASRKKMKMRSLSEKERHLNSRKKKKKRQD